MNELALVGEIRTELAKVNKTLDRKSNIKDVCALLDLKSSKF